MATVAPAVAAKQFFAVVTALFNYNYVNVTTDPKKLADVVSHIISSAKQIGSIANSTGLTFKDVNRTLTEVYVCLNTTLATKPSPLYAWNCLQASISKPVTTFNCETFGYNLDAMLLGILLCITILFVFIWSFLGKRKSCLLKCCFGFPRAIVPLNMLDSYENRFGYAAAFGVTTSYCTNMLFGSAKSVLGSEWGKIIDASPSYVGIIFKMIGTAVIAMSAFPLFVSMSTHHKVVGSIFGLMYSLTWLGLLIWITISYSSVCSDPNRAEGVLVFQLLERLPQYACLFFLVFKFAFVLFKAIRKRQGKWMESPEKVHSDFKEEYMYAHVKNLLKGVPLDPGPPEVENFKTKIKKKFYKWNPHFKYSVRVICAFFVSGITVYYIAMASLFATWYYLSYLLGSFVNSSDFASRFVTITQNNIALVKEVRYHFNIWTICLYVSLAIATLKSIIIFLNMLAWYRGHMMRLRRGDRSWLPTSVRTLSASPASLVASSMKYAGFQVAYAAWGYGIFAILLWIVLGAAISFVFYPLFAGKKSLALDLVYKVWPTALISLVIVFAQTLSAKFFFLQQKGAVISVNNRRAFHITSYYLFFFNIFLGLFSCLLRILKSVVIGVLFLERVQKSLLPRSFEKMDPGYYAYIGYILTEHSHANPVLCVFFFLLTEKAKKSEKVAVVTTLSVISEDKLIKNSDSLDMSSVGGKDRRDRWKNVRNRWHLAYTLINNPSLAKYRKSNVDEEQEDSEDKKSIAEEEQMEYATPVSV